MADYDHAGRISKEAFYGSSIALLAVCVVATVSRFYIRIFVHKTFQWDDGFLLIGLICLIAAMALLFVVMDVMYETEQTLFGTFTTIPPDVLTKSMYYRRMSASALTLMWISICTVKFSFLSLFRRLIYQMPPMLNYWWFALVFNIIVTAYGTSVYLVACPYFKDDQLFTALQCVSGSGLSTALNYSTSTMVLDIAGDIFILVIPILLIWQIRIRYTQKIALALTLCLTLIMIIISITRLAGLKWQGKLDSIWETYFVVVAAEVGLILVAITAFRTLFVSKMKDRREKAQVKMRGFKTSWISKTKSRIVRFVSGGRSEASGNPSNPESFNVPLIGKKRLLSGRFPGATMTGMRTFIDGNGRTKMGTVASTTDGSLTLHEDDEEFLQYPPRALRKSNGSETHIVDQV